jgi:hypothetical protein
MHTQICIHLFIFMYKYVYMNRPMTSLVLHYDQSATSRCEVSVRIYSIFPFGKHHQL